MIPYFEEAIYHLSSEHFSLVLFTVNIWMFYILDLKSQARRLQFETAYKKAAQECMKMESKV